MEELNWKLHRKYEAVTREIPQAETFMIEDARLVVIAYGTAARIAKGAIKALREKGIRAGLFRPITLWPYPDEQLRDICRTVTDFTVFEMSTGQMIDDVRLALEGRANIHFYGRPGGPIPTPVEIEQNLHSTYQRQRLNKLP
jgi:2-oxoglutarate ferredoxin oxidoreductase subunit alpha